MTVVGLHPEELFDKLLAGEITQSEQERLRQHLDSCEVCRFEWEARGDFQAEALALGAEGPPPLMPLRAPPPVSRLQPRRRRSRLAVLGLAAAALIASSGAVASVVTGRAPWHAMSSVFTSTAASTSQQRAAKPALRAPGGCKGADCSAAAAPVTAATVASGPTRAAQQAPAKEPARAGSAASRLARPAPQRAGRAEASASAAPAAPEHELVTAPVLQEPSSSAQLFADANQARRAGDVGRASGLYRMLQEQFPSSSEAALSRVTLALLLLDSGDAQGALVGFERYLAGSSRGLEAEALVGRARALGRLGRRDLELAAWQEVRSKYPRSIYGRQASERLAALGRP